MSDTVYEGDETLVSLKEFKRQRRQKQKERRKRKLEMLKLEPSRQSYKPIQHMKVSKPSVGDIWLMLSRCIAFISIGLFLASEAGILAINGYQQNNSDIPAWMSLINSWLPVVRNLAALCAITALPRIARQGLKPSLVAIPLLAFFSFWSWNNFHQWTERMNINATREQETHIRKEIENTPLLVLKKQSLDIALEDKKRTEKDARIQCDQNDGTKCIRARTSATKAKDHYEVLEREYNQALEEAKSKAISETAPLNNKQLNWMNAFLPLTAGVLLSLL